MSATVHNAALASLMLNQMVNCRDSCEFNDVGYQVLVFAFLPFIILGWILSFFPLVLVHERIGLRW